jgi:UDP-glucuronate 4-epimerase
MLCSESGATLVTGAAGFIGFHAARRLLNQGHRVLGVDSLNAYYDVGLKQSRLECLQNSPNFTFVRLDLAQRAATEQFFSEHPVRRVLHLAAQAGVRYSVENPHAYLDNNLAAFLNILEGCRAQKVEHLLFASSSSVYGSSHQSPFSEHNNVDHPVSLYAATKKANEAMAHSYAHLYGFPCTAARLFTVYGPWGRPDMALFGFTRAILTGQAIDIYNNGEMKRDFTYIDDVVEGLTRLLRIPAQPDPGWHSRPPDPA